MGEQNDEAESFAILDEALRLGVNFFDTAEREPPCRSTPLWG